MKLKIIHGPNLNMLGKRDVNVYGHKTYQDLVTLIDDYCKSHHISVSFFQSNHEGELIDEIHSTFEMGYDALIINPGAYTHYSYALRDALDILTCLKVEVHLSDIYNREDFRKINVINDVIDHSIVGLGFDGYLEAIKYCINHYKQ